MSGGSGTTRFLYDGDALVGEYDASGNLLRRYVHGSNAAADDPLVWYEGATLSPSVARLLKADHQGSITALTDWNGYLAAINSYDEWGIPGLGNEGRFQYTGQAWLAELGMYYYKARIYSPTLGRFLQTDPIGYEDQVILYAYVGNEPINRTDPTGMRCVISNAGSAYCLRRDIYRIYDQDVATSTRFFGAAAWTVEYLANNDIPGFGNVISDRAEGFLRDVSASLFTMNARAHLQIMNGSISSRNLDARMVHMEQTRVQSMLDALSNDDRESIVGSLNSAFNSRLRGLSGLGNQSDDRYNRVLDGVIEDLGRPNRLWQPG